jgi:hypothetical protein
MTVFQLLNLTIHCTAIALVTYAVRHHSGIARVKVSSNLTPLRKVLNYSLFDTDRVLGTRERTKLRALLKTPGLGRDRKGKRQ